MGNKREPKRVWVLGAGFSRALGGPLLPDLLSWNMAEEIRARFGDGARELDSDPYSAYARWLFEYGNRASETEARRPPPLTGEMRAAPFVTAARLETPISFPRARLWRDAEVFLDFVDCAARNRKSPQYDRFLRIVASIKSGNDAPTVSAVKLSAAARRIVAAECAAFLHRENLSAERWDPYVRWASKLTEIDTIITFNYDLVFERLRELLESPKFEIVAIERAARAAPCPVLKLHGSVNWLFFDAYRQFKKGPDDLVLREDGAQVAIGVPGPGKVAVASGPFAWLWREAEAAIRDATEIWFIGYRFPESDAHARGVVLDALRVSECRDVHTVLGPNNPDTPRLRALLRWARPNNSSIASHPLWAEDFLGVWDPKVDPTFIFRSDYGT